MNLPFGDRTAYCQGCWQGWTGGRPKRLTTMQVCRVLTDRRPPPHAPTHYDIQREMDAWLGEQGIRFHAARWKAHAHDLEKAAGTWGFAVGTTWEQAVRTWLTTCYGARFFVPQRWLLVTDRAGVTHYREVDGIERVDATQAFVYEIKHGTPGYGQLAKEYTPLLRLAYPERVFTPIEINAEDPYRWYHPQEAPPIHRLHALDDRAMTGQYQLLVFAEIPQYACYTEGKGAPDA